MFFKDDWLSWTYNGVKFGNKTTPQTKLEFQFKKVISRPLKSHKEELLENTRAMRDRFNEPFDLMFSGGVDSEIILRCHIELGIPINVFIFKYNNDYNAHDVRHALRICNELNITPVVIDFNLEKFFENDAYDIWKHTYDIQAGRLPQMKMIEYLDNIPIMGDGCPYWVYSNGEWIFELDEVGHGQSIYAITQQRTVLADWFEYSPESILSHLNMPRIQNLFNSKEIPTKYTFEFTKYFVYKDIWPDIVPRPKRNGYERFETLPKMCAVTELQEFQKNYINTIDINHTCYQYTKDELITLLS